MPTYLIHGFRWQRKAIRIFVILQDIDDATPDWIIAAPTALLNTFYTIFDFLPAAEPTPETSPSRSIPRLATSKPSSGPASAATAASKNGEIKESASFNDWSLVKLLEQYDAQDLETLAQPYAYVGDYVVPIDLSCDVSKEIEAYEQRKTEEMISLSLAASSINTPASTGSRSPAIPGTGGYFPKSAETGKGHETERDTVANLADTGAHIRKMSSRDFRRRKKRIGWLEKLRDQLQKEAEIGWYVVVCEDEERRVDGVISPKPKRNGTFAVQTALRDGENGLEGEGLVTPTSSSTLGGGIKKFFRRNSQRSLGRLSKSKGKEVA